jgi:hypothetical protein
MNQEHRFVRIGSWISDDEPSLVSLHEDDQTEWATATVATLRSNARTRAPLFERIIRQRLRALACLPVG